MSRASDTDDSELPWPECLGTFDEESCRFFLRELGQKVVQFYPFSLGMEEVFAQILDEYALDGAADAISVLQELLEDDSTAAGAGDDGDIWRSWRYNWRHRNDDPLNPYIPRAQGRILGPPTSTRIRLLKSNNFVAGQLAKAKARSTCLSTRTTSSANAIERTSRLANESNGQNPTSRPRAASTAVYEHQQGLSSNLALAARTVRQSSRGSRSIVKSGSGKIEPILEDRQIIPTSSDAGTDKGSERSEERALLPAMRYNPTLGNVISESPRRSMPAPSRKHDFPFNLASPRRRSCTISREGNTAESAQHGPSDLGSMVEERLEKGDGENGEAASKSLSPTTNSTGQTPSEANEKTPLSIRFGRHQENRYSLPSELGSAEIDSTPSKRRALHRQARMIDGALFHPRTRKGKFIESDAIGENSPVKGITEKSAKRLSSQSAQHASSPRASWLQNVLNRFRSESNRKQQPKLRKRHSSLADCGMASPSKHNTPAVTRTAEMRQVPPPSMSFGFNGANEYHNKPLPLSPADEGRRSLASETQRTFFGRGPNNNLLLTKASATSTPKQSDLASLVSATMTGPQELSPKEKRWKYSSSNSSHNGPPSPSSFATFAKKNPYDDSSAPSTPGIGPPPPLAYHKREITSTEWPFRAQKGPSQPPVEHELNVSATLLPVRQPNTSAHIRPATPEDDDERRGRRSASPLSPLKAKFGISPTKKRRPRSRSPVKRLLGMVKSISTNQIPTYDPPSKTAIPSSTNKRRWKELSHKVKHGFLTADLEQLEQEEMMELHMSGDATADAVRIITPPSDGNRLVYPVSLKSAGQNILWSELEFALIETANKFLKDELEAGRLSQESVLRVKRHWQARNRPQVVELYYDQATQYELVIANLRTVKLYSDYCQDAIMLNSVLHQWKILIRELSVKTLCMPDSIVRRWIHDGRRVLELLGASHHCLSKFDKISTLCLSVINSHEKERGKQRKASGTTENYGSHRRSVSDGSQNTTYIHEAALMAQRPFYAQDEAPPMPTPTSMGSTSRKVTPQERVVVRETRRSQERNRGSTGHYPSKSLPSVEDRGRFYLD